MSTDRLPAGRMQPTAWEVLCPYCGTTVQLDCDMVEDSGGGISPEPAERWPVCEECHKQFEIVRAWVNHER